MRNEDYKRKLKVRSQVTSLTPPRRSYMGAYRNTTLQQLLNIQHMNLVCQIQKEGLPRSRSQWRLHINL